MRAFFAMESRGELPPGTARQWAHESQDQGIDLKKLPKRLHPKKKMKPLKVAGNYMFPATLKAAQFLAIEEMRRRMGLSK
jgi:hypothetical protein